jgi:hypothetical protein
MNTGDLRQIRTALSEASRYITARALEQGAEQAPPVIALLQRAIVAVDDQLDRIRLDTPDRAQIGTGLFDTTELRERAYALADRALEFLSAAYSVFVLKGGR